MTNIEIRRPKVEDLEELHLFFRDVIMDTFEKEGIGHLTKDIDEEIETKKSYLQSDYESDGQNRYFLIATYGDIIVGTIEYGPVSSIICKSTNGALCDFVEVGTIFVHPDFQRKGIGNRLLQSLFAALINKNIEDICLDSGYKNAQKIWKNKFGNPDYVLKDYWGEGFDHMIWRVKVTKLEE
ncbi:GNAT family N-acetyltransferase [Bacillus sp. JJ1562]|uniref:GNAT family N-acetyltransferase n=1 Tax=Bacillus sp. JJ1562 TaxID=3122960 RepID=UPI0030033ECD